MNVGSYKVGQVLYIVNNTSNTIVPGQVIEETTRKTISGEAVSYTIRVGAVGNHKDIDVAKINGELFGTAEHARKALVERATNAVIKLMENAVNKALEWYPDAFEHSEPVQQPPTLEAHSEDVFVDLGDGRKARVKMPSN